MVKNKNEDMKKVSVVYLASTDMLLRGKIIQALFKHR